ncbi:transmembrane protein 251 isoform X2 [Crotalus tigris]|uniref:transmembrane protein 251 isoform X2 n=1 Tax=Crotalus tigris TaxID=88082 RepID=UPI00192F1AE1|nr:transmembrane protein 251 isoform X2 [Crotalus tigris]
MVDREDRQGSEPGSVEVTIWIGDHQEVQIINLRGNFFLKKENPRRHGQLFLYCCQENMRRAWRMMNFRQRMGWIGVGLYLIASAAAFYYVFEINETYNQLALEHIQQPPEKFKQEISWMHSLKTRLLSVPFWLWAIIFLIPYLQMFLFLYSCTRADPKTVGYCIIPICLAVVCNRHQTFAKASNQISRLQLIDT